MDYYAVLDVVPSATAEEITRAYHKLAAKYHPDKHQGNVLEDLAKDKLVQLNEAYNILSAPALRSAYDAARAEGATPSAAPSYSNNAPPANKQSKGTTAKPGKMISQLAILVLLIFAMPYIFRIIKSPRAALLVGAVIAVAWFGPRIVRKLRRK